MPVSVTVAPGQKGLGVTVLATFVDAKQVYVEEFVGAAGEQVKPVGHRFDPAELLLVIAL